MSIVNRLQSIANSQSSPLIQQFRTNVHDPAASAADDIWLGDRENHGNLWRLMVKAAEDDFDADAMRAVLLDIINKSNESDDLYEVADAVYTAASMSEPWDHYRDLEAVRARVQVR